MADEPKTERKSITVVEVNEPVSHQRRDGKGSFQILQFKATDGKKTLTFKTFNSGLFDAIQSGEILDCDIQETQREWEGDIITERRVVQIYKDGAPVVAKRQGGGSWGKSPEEIRLERHSIEGQVAMKEVGEWIRCVTPSHPCPKELIEQYINVLKVKLTGLISDVPQAIPSSAQPLQRERPKSLEQAPPPEPIAPPVGERLDPSKEKNRIYMEILETLQLHGRLSREGAVNWLLELCEVKEAKEISLDQLIAARDKAKSKYQES